MADLINEWFMAPSVKANYRTMVYYPGAGSDTFEINFEGGFINKTDVKSFMVKDTTRERTDLAVTFIGGSLSRVKTSQVVPIGWTVCIYRDTPKSKPLAKFTDGAIINEKNLDRNAQQAMFAVSEMVDRFDSTVEAVESALVQVNESNQKADEAIRIANKATTTANSAVVKADSAITIANNASSKADTAINTANSAKSTAEGLDAQIKSANAKSDTAIKTANAATVTANDAKTIAQGIDAKATLALSNSKTALDTANGIDAKATQALNTAKEAKETADKALVSVGIAKELTDRVESFPSTNNVKWKGSHAFTTGVNMYNGSTTATFQMHMPSESIRMYIGDGSACKLFIDKSGATLNDKRVHFDTVSRPIYTDFIHVMEATNPYLRTTQTNTNSAVYWQTVNNLPVVSLNQSGERKFNASFPLPRAGGVSQTIAYESHIDLKITQNANETSVRSPNSRTYVVVKDNGEYGLYSNTLNKWTLKKDAGEWGQLNNFGNITATTPTDYVNMSLIKGDGRKLVIETVPHTSSAMGLIIYREANNSNISVLGLPRRTGTLAVADDHYTKTETYTRLEIDSKVTSIKPPVTTTRRIRANSSINGDSYTYTNNTAADAIVMFIVYVSGGTGSTGTSYSIEVEGQNIGDITARTNENITHTHTFTISPGKSMKLHPPRSIGVTLGVIVKSI